MSLSHVSFSLFAVMLPYILLGFIILSMLLEIFVESIIYCHDLYFCILQLKLE